MARKQRDPATGGPQDRPVEINMTDLAAAEPDRFGQRRDAGDPYAAGTPGGGSSVGGLAGTNVGDGDPDNADLERALGSGIHDNAQDAEEEDDLPLDLPLGGPSGGAVGGTPAGLRASGDNIHKGIAPGGDHRGDSTIGSDPERPA